LINWRVGASGGGATEVHYRAEFSWQRGTERQTDRQRERERESGGSWLCLLLPSSRLASAAAHVSCDAILSTSALILTCAVPAVLSG